MNVNLSIEVGSDPITGLLATAAGQDPRRFSGWVELAGAIEDIRGRRAGGGAGQSLGWVPGAEGEERG